MIPIYQPVNVLACKCNKNHIYILFMSNVFLIHILIDGSYLEMDITWGFFSPAIYIRPQGYKSFFMLNSYEHHISTAHKH